MLLASCAQVGAVRAPTAGLPQPVSNVQALRLGPKISLQFTAPANTSDGFKYDAARYGAVRYQACVWPGVEKGEPAKAAIVPIAGGGVAVAPQVPARHPPQPGIHGRYRTPAGALMPPCQQLVSVNGHRVAVSAIAAKTPLATLAVAAEGASGEWAGWSNPVVIALTPVAAPPELEHIELQDDGARLNWQLPPKPPAAIVVYRQSGTAAPEAVAHLAGSATSYVDGTIAWDQTYVYWLRSAAGSGAARAESADSRHVTIRTADVFPPPAPTGLQAVVAPAGAGVDLSWNAVTAPDLAGYNVYRQLAGSSVWQKRNAAPLPTPVFHDELAAGATAAHYAVTAIDTAGNESKRSAPVAIPQAVLALLDAAAPLSRRQMRPLRCSSISSLVTRWAMSSSASRAMAAIWW